MSSPFYVVTTQSGTALTVSVMAVAGSNVETAGLQLSFSPAVETFVSVNAPTGWSMQTNFSTNRVALFDASFNSPAGGTVNSLLVKLNFTLASASTTPSGTVTVTDYSDLNGNSYPAQPTLQLSGSAPCFAMGTRLLTPKGGRAVESLKAGGRVALANGGTGRIVWVGHRSVDTARHPRPWDVRPVRVRADALGRGLPCRDLVLSPDHALLIEGVLVPVRSLVNGGTIAQEHTRHVTYFHVELERHAVVLAEGVAAESYLDTGNRNSFSDEGQVVAAHADFERGETAGMACAPLVLEGPNVEAAQTRIAAQARLLGWRQTEDAGLAVTIDGNAHVLRLDGDAIDMMLPLGARTLVLHSKAAPPAHVAAGHEDLRLLGVPVTAIALDGEDVSLDDPRLSAGWHAAEPDLRWTDGAAEIDVRRARRIRVEVARLNLYWTAPALADDYGIRASA